MSQSPASIDMTISSQDDHYHPMSTSAVDGKGHDDEDEVDGDHPGRRRPPDNYQTTPVESVELDEKNNQNRAESTNSPHSREQQKIRTKSKSETALFSKNSKTGSSSGAVSPRSREQQKIQSKSKSETALFSKNSKTGSSSGAVSRKANLKGYTNPLNPLAEEDLHVCRDDGDVIPQNYYHHKIIKQYSIDDHHNSDEDDLGGEKDEKMKSKLFQFRSPNFFGGSIERNDSRSNSPANQVVGPDGRVVKKIRSEPDVVQGKKPDLASSLISRTKSLDPNHSTELDSLSPSHKSDSGVSFSTVQFLLGGMHKMQNRIIDKRPEVEKAVTKGDLDEIHSLCREDENSIHVAAFSAVKLDKRQVLASLMDLKGTDFQFRDPIRNTGLLHEGVRNNSLDCIDYLLLRGFRSDEWDSVKRSTPLHIAVEHEDLNMVKILSGFGDLNVGSDENALSPVHAAIKKNNLEILKSLVTKGVTLKAKYPYHDSAIHTACENNAETCARFLIENDVSVVHQTRYGKETPLHIAAFNNNREILNLLLENTAEIDAVNYHGETPLHVACKNVANCSVQKLCERGANVNAVDKDGRPPLHCVINSRNRGGTECMLTLLKTGANINAADKNGNTALHLAAANRKLGRVKLLIHKGADMCVKNDAGKSAIYFVMKHVPSSLKAIEDRLDSDIQPGESDNQYTGMMVKMRFDGLMYRQDKKTATGFEMMRRNSVDSNANPKKLERSVSTVRPDHFYSDVSLFDEILKMNHGDNVRIMEKILMHPLSQSFLHLKWQQMKWLYYIGIVAPHIIFSIVYSVYVILVFNILCKPDQEQDLTQVSYLKRLELETKCKEMDQWWWIIAWICWVLLIIFNIIYLGKELMKILHYKFKYWKEAENIFNLMTAISFPFISFRTNPFVSPKSRPEIVFYAYQYHAAACGVLITWVMQMFLIGKVPKFGLYVQMLQTVSMSFLNFFVAYSSLVVGFALSFTILFPREISFEEALVAPIKVLVMMTGEIEYNDLYYPRDNVLAFNMTKDENGTFQGNGAIDEQSSAQYFPLTAHFILTVFIVVIAIVIMNLLFGIAVSDVQELYKMARLHQSIQQVRLISYMESVLHSPIFRKLPFRIQSLNRSIVHLLRGRFDTMKYCNVDLSSYEDRKKLPSHVNDSLKEKCAEMSQNRSDQPTLRNLMTVVKKMESQMQKQQLIMQKLTKKLDKHQDRIKYLGKPTPQSSGEDSSLQVIATSLTVDDEFFENSADESDEFDNLDLEPEDPIDGETIRVDENVFSLNEGTFTRRSSSMSYNLGTVYEDD